MSEKKDHEALLSLNLPSQKAINEEIEERIKKLKAPGKKAKGADITDIKKAGEQEIFSKNACWTMTNLKTLQEFEITGVNADFNLQGMPHIREMLVSGEIDGFLRGDCYVKFKHVRQG